MTHQQVVVAFDFSELGAVVLARAINLVSRAPSHVLHFITVIDPHVEVPGIPRDGAIDYRYADRVREALADEVRGAFGATPISEEIQFFVHARIGKPASEILELAREVGADLIMMGTHGRTGLKHLVLGSTAEHVVREAGSPVIVVRPKSYPDVALTKVISVGEHPHKSRVLQFSYRNTQVVMKPPHWM